MKYNLIQYKHDKIVEMFKNNKITKDMFFEFEKIIEDQKQFFTIWLN